MRYYEFVVDVCFGKGDYGETEINYPATDEEDAVLFALFQKDGTLNNENIKARNRELYNKILAAAAQCVTDELSGTAFDTGWDSPEGAADAYGLTFSSTVYTDRVLEKRARGIK